MSYYDDFDPANGGGDENGFPNLPSTVAIAVLIVAAALLVIWVF